MAKKNPNDERFHVRLDLPDHVRADLLNRFPPMFPNVYCRVITLAYKVDKNYKVDPHPVVKVCGIHRGEFADALLVLVNNEINQPIREGEPAQRPHFITLSVADGHGPVEGGIIDPDKAIVWSPDKRIPLNGLRPRRQLLRVMSPERFSAREQLVA